jgi:hypothetical protein
VPLGSKEFGDASLDRSSSSKKKLKGVKVGFDAYLKRIFGGEGHPPN